MWWIVFLGLALAAVVALAIIGVRLNRKAKLLQTAIDELNQGVESLKRELDTASTWQAPANNVLDNPVTTTQAWLKRRATSEQKKAERQRRLISRLTKRK